MKTYVAQYKMLYSELKWSKTCKKICNYTILVKVGSTLCNVLTTMCGFLQFLEGFGWDSFCKTYFDKWASRIRLIIWLASFTHCQETMIVILTIWNFLYSTRTSSKAEITPQAVADEELKQNKEFTGIQGDGSKSAAHKSSSTHCVIIWN